VNIAVVGCGVAGPAAAIFFKRAGHEVSVFERAPQLGPVGAGILLQPGGLKVLDRLGCGDEARRMGEAIHCLEGFVPSGRRILNLPYATLKDGKTGIGIHRGRLFTLLLEKMTETGIIPQTGREIKSVDQINQVSAALTFVDGSKAGPFDLVIIADGARAQALCGSWRPQAPACHAWGAWWMSLPDPERSFTGVLHQVFDGPTRLLGVLPTGISKDGESSSVSIFWGIRLSEAKAWQECGMEECRRQMLKLEPRLASVLQGLESADQMTLARYFRHTSKHWFHGPVVSIGDAAHAMSPHLGQGANLALLDAAALTDSLAKGGSINSALSDYQRAREGHVNTYAFFSRVVTPFFQSDLKTAAFLRDSLMPVACGIPFLRKRMLRVLRGEIFGLEELLVSKGGNVNCIYTTM